MVEVKAKQKLRWTWFLAIPMMFVVLFVAQMWGPNPTVRIAPETTYVTSHIGPDRYPNYKAYLRDEMEKDVPTVENGAVLIWRAMWPGELSAKDMPIVAEALGMTMPNPDEALVPVYNNQLKDKLAAMMKAKLAQPSNDDDDDFDQDPLLHERAEKLIDQAMNRPWTSKQLPAMSEWAKSNEQPLDWLVEGAGLPKFYNPSPSMLEADNGSLVEMLLPGIQMLRVAARALSARAMWHLGEGRTMEAWRDLRACHQIARHTSSGTTLIENLVGIAVDNMASQGTQTLLHHSHLTSEQARQILTELEAMSYMPSLSKSMAEGERIMYLDCVTRMAKGEWSLTNFSQNISGDANQVVAFVTSTKIDWNIVLEDGNQWYDRLAEALSLPRKERMSAIHQVTEDIRKLGAANNPKMIAGSLVSSKVRSQLISNVLIMQFLPAAEAVAEAWDRSDAIVDLNQLSAALAVYRAENGEYSESLNQLVPGILSKMPIDTFSDKPFIYRRSGEGFVLYSVFRNGVDDGGTNFDGQIVKGKWVNEETADYVDLDNSDIVVLVPRPAFEIPTDTPQH